MSGAEAVTTGRRESASREQVAKQRTGLRKIDNKGGSVFSRKEIGFTAIKTRPGGGPFIIKKNGRLLTSHRSTTYPCYIPVLGDSVGAGCVRPAARKNSQNRLRKKMKFQSVTFIAVCTLAGTGATT